MLQACVIYGAGQRGQKLCKLLNDLDIPIAALLDSDKDKIGSELCGHVVESASAVLNHKNNPIVISVANEFEAVRIRRSLGKILGGEIKHELSWNDLISMAYEESPRIKKFISETAKKGGSAQNIIFFCPNGLVLGGVETWTLDICKALIDSGFDNTFILAKDGINIAYDVSPSIRERLIFSEINVLSALSMKQLIEKMADKLPCKVVLAFQDATMLAAHLLKREYPKMIEIIRVVHAGHPDVYADCMKSQRYVDFFVGGSRSIGEEMRNIGFAPNQVGAMTIPFQCDKVLKRSYSVNSNEPIRIAYAGRLDSVRAVQKRMDLILRLIQELADRQIGFIFDIAGEGPARKEMEVYIDEKHLSQHVNFLGKLGREQIKTFWKCHDICVNLSDFEGRTISVCEAMGAGAVPVVTNTAGVAREEIEDGVNGYVVPIGDYAMAADKIEYLYYHRNRLPELGECAHNAVYPSSLMQPHVEFWKKILKG